MPVRGVVTLYFPDESIGDKIVVGDAVSDVVIEGKVSGQDIIVGDAIVEMDASISIRLHNNEMGQYVAGILKKGMLVGLSIHEPGEK